jgi:NAD(P)-dependent dehydrogenase (short-subunit alcohol dehydrogenase family)
LKFSIIMTAPQSILITGCSSGIGQALALEFKMRGHTVFATARQAQALANLTAMGLIAVELDVTSQQSIDNAREQIQSQTRRLDMLINNAGYGQFGAVLDTDSNALRRQFETNVIAPVALSRTFLPLLKLSSSACIANIGSISGIATTPFAGAYCASKAALHALSDAMRMELEPLGVRVVTVQPGGIKSKFGDNAEHEIQFPKDSPYAAISKSIQGRAKMSQIGATPAEAFAKTVVNHLLDKNANPVCRAGKHSTRLPMLKLMLPTKTLDSKMRKLFGLDQL